MHNTVSMDLQDYKSACKVIITTRKFGCAYIDNTHTERWLEIVETIVVYNVCLSRPQDAQTELGGGGGSVDRTDVCHVCPLSIPFSNQNSFYIIKTKHCILGKFDDWPYGYYLGSKWLQMQY